MLGTVQSTLKVIMAAAALAIAAPGFAQAAPLDIAAGAYSLDKTHASITFKVTHMGLSHYTMRFAVLDAKVTLDPKDVTKSSVSATIDPRSVRTDFPFPEKEDFDKVIAEKFLNASQFPTITFQSTRLVATGPKTGKLTGNLTLMGVTKPVTLDVTLNGAREHPMYKVAVLGITATGSFNRSDFGSTVLVGPVSDQVTLTIEAEFLNK